MTPTFHHCAATGPSGFQARLLPTGTRACTGLVPGCCPVSGCCRPAATIPKACPDTPVHQNRVSELVHCQHKAKEKTETSTNEQAYGKGFKKDFDAVLVCSAKWSNLFEQELTGFGTFSKPHARWLAHGCIRDESTRAFFMWKINYLYNLKRFLFLFCNGAAHCLCLLPSYTAAAVSAIPCINPCFPISYVR